MTTINHPLPLKTTITANRPVCTCKNKDGWELTTGTIEKIIPGGGTTWYYLNIGITVKDQWVISAEPQQQ